MKKGTVLRSLIILFLLTAVSGIEIKYNNSNIMLIVAFIYASLVLVINRKNLWSVI